jgi:hypothetical protein
MEGSRIFTVAIVMAVLSLVAASSSAADKGPNKPVGNCSDVAFHEKSNRLFVAAGAAGLHLLEVKDGKMSLVTTVSDGGAPRKLALLGDRLYAADVKRGLVVLDLAGKDPVCTWKQEKGQGMGISVQDHYAYLAAGAEGLQVFDLSAADAPKLTGQCKTGGEARDVWINGKYAYVADEQGLAVVDVSVPSRPQRVSLVAWDPEKSAAQTVRGEGRLAYVAAGRQGLVTVDVENPLRPTVVSRYKSHPSGFAKGLCVREGLVYLANANGDSPEDSGLIVLDTHDPKSPKLKGRCAFAGNVEGVCPAGHYLFIANTLSGIRSVDIRDPNHLKLVDSFGSTEQTVFVETQISPREREIIEYLRKTKQEVLQGRKFNDLSTPVHTLLTLLSAYQNRDLNALTRVSPLAKKEEYAIMLSPELGAKFLAIMGKATVFRVDVEDRPPQESDLAAIFFTISPDQKTNQILKFGYVQGAWRFLGSAGGAWVLQQDWRPGAKPAEEATRNILQEETKKDR